MVKNTEITLQRQWDLYKLCNIYRPILRAREATYRISVKPPTAQSS